MYIRNFNYLNCRNGMPVPSTIKSQENNNSMNQSVVLECLVPALAGNKKGCGSPSWYVTAKSHRFYFPLNTKRALRSLTSQRPTTHKPKRRRVCRTKLYHNPQLQSINELSFWILRHRLQRRHWFCARWNRLGCLWSVPSEARRRIATLCDSSMMLWQWMGYWMLTMRCW